MSIEMITFLIIGLLLTFIVLGYPLAYVLGGVALIFGYIFIGPQIGNLFMLRIFTVTQDYILIAIPLFIFMGVVIEKSGLAERLYDSMYVLMGNLRGGLAVATVITCTIFAAATGVIGASVVTMGLLALPSMLKYKYDKPLATGSICAGGTLGILIPPSVLILVYGPTASISIGRLFAAAFIPGILLASMYVAYVIIRCYINPSLGPALPESAIKVSPKEKLIMFLTSVLPVSALIIAVLGSIFFGLAAPTEAAAVGAFASCLLALAYKQLNFANLREIVYRAMRVNAMIFLVLIMANFYTNVFIRIGGGRVIEEMVLGLPLPPWGIILTMWAIIIVMGMFIDWIGVIMLAVPLFTPIGAALGFDPLWFAMMNIVVMQVSFLSPPFAYAIFYLKGIAPPEVRTMDIYRGIVPFIVLQLIGVSILAAFPNIILYLPRLFGLY